MESISRIRAGKAKSFKFHNTIYSGQELRDRMEQIGFMDVKLYGSFDGDEYGVNAQRLIAVGHKPMKLKQRNLQEFALSE